MTAAAPGSSVTTAAPLRARAGGPAPPPRPRASLRALGYVALASLAYVPVLASAPGKVAADTKQYLYLDPTRLLERAPSMWDPNIGLGTVTHQNIGYLFPMGPFYWGLNAVGLPDWVAQRLWLGSILFGAALGVLYLLRTLGMRGPGVVAAALVYMLSPYSLDFAARISVILLPFAGLPWMIALVVRALRRGGWAYPALFAIVVQVVGGVNATALLFAGLGAALWIPYAVWIAREVPGRRALGATLRIGLLTLLTSSWWIAGLVVQGKYGLDVLRYTETLQTVTTTSTAPEVLRGLGYWFFYGGDKLGVWIEASLDYMLSVPLIVVGYALPVLAMLAAATTRWRHRIYFAGIALVGVVIAVGAHPYDDPSLYGRAFRWFGLSSSAGLALRSTGRAVPLVALGLAVLLGAGVNALADWWRARGRAWLGVAAALLVMALAAANLPALWNDTFYGRNLRRPEDVPRYWTEAIAALDRGSHQTRVLEIPGADFASYTWGNTVDPITPGLTDRPYVARELIPWGSPASADLLNALDRRLQEGVLERGAVVPIARLMGVGALVDRSDLQTERFDLARPRATWLLLTAPRPPGLGAPQSFGTWPPPGPAPRFPQLDELALALPADTPSPPPVAVFPVHDATPIVRAQPSDRPLVVAGDGEGLVDAAATGLLDDGAVVLYAGSFADDPTALRRELRRGAVLVVTDSNRKRARRWSTIRDNHGHTERPDEQQLTRDEGDARLPVFPGAGTGSFTVVEQHGVRADATRYGNVITLEPERRAAKAVDGDVGTSWNVGQFAHVLGERIRLTFPKAVTADRLGLVQPLVGPRDRWITEATLTFDGTDPVKISLGDRSRTPEGQTVTFPRRTFRTLELRVDDTNVGDSTVDATSGVGLAEIRVRGAGATRDVRLDEVVRMPRDLVDASRGRSLEHRLLYLMSRSRLRLVPPRHAQDEPAMVRRFRVPDARGFTLRGAARLASDAPDSVLDAALDAAPAGSAVTATASERLPGDPAARASAAIDGDPATAWSTAFGSPAAQWIEVGTPGPVTVDRLDLRVVADGRHSVPTRLRVEAGGQSRVVEVPPVTDGAAGATADVPVTFAPLTGTTFRFTIDEVRPVETTEYYADRPITMPVAIAELGIPGVSRPPVGDAVAGRCRTDLLTLDGRPVPARVDGSRVTAERGDPLDLEVCDSAATLALARGDHVLRARPGRDTGLDVDRLTLASEAGGAALPLGPGGEVPPVDPARPRAPRVRVVEDGRTRLRLHVDGADAGREPFWLVLGQSQNAGWRATVNGHDLGGSTLVDGYANGWLVRPTGRDLAITLDWTPQRRVWIAIAISVVALLVAVALALTLLVRRRREPVDAGSGSVDDRPVLASPLTAGGRRPGPVALVAVPLGTAVVAATVTRPWIGAVAGLLVLGTLLRPRLRPLVALGAPAALALAGLYIAVQQHRYRHPPLLEWPTFFERVHDLGWLAIVLLVADAVVVWARTREPGAPAGTIADRAPPGED